MCKRCSLTKGANFLCDLYPNGARNAAGEWDANLRPRSVASHPTLDELLGQGCNDSRGPLHCAPRARQVCLLAIASHDTERYLPTMSTDFLVRIGELVTEALNARGA